MSVTKEWFGDDKKHSVDKGTIKALIRSSNIVQASAKIQTPVKTGNLRSSIVTAIDENDFTARVGTNTEYAPSVEFGTKKQRSQPYLRRALNDNKKVIKSIFEIELEKAID